MTIGPITAEHVATAPAFLDVALPEAIRTIAKKNGRTVSETIDAYRLGVPNVVNGVRELLHAAAEELANRIENEGNAS